MLKLDKSEQILVLRTVEQIKSSSAGVGKELAGELRGCRSARTGSNGRLRIVFHPTSRDFLQLITVGPRERGVVYAQALKVLKDLEQ
jgi:hypothetical protein